MRNLKRTLSMLLAAVMVLGLMVVGAGAVSLDDFSDRDEIVNDEAVLVLTTLNVINGKDNGSYDPTGTITRGEMTKMICVILNGGSDPILAETVNNSYTDTVGHWAAPYIEYCTALGIVAGRGDKKFDPDGNVSVAEAAKMLLVAIGYNAGVEGYVGNNWQINTDVRANQLDIYDGMEDMNTSTILTRDNAALMCYNALDVHMVTYKYVITGNADNAITTKPQLDDTKLGTLLWEKFGAVKVTGVVLANEFADMGSRKTDPDRAPNSTVVGSALDEGKTKIYVTNDGDGQEIYSGEHTFNISTGEDVLGKAVNMYIKPAKDSSNDNRAVVIGSAILNENNVIITDCSGDTLDEVLDDHNLTRETDVDDFPVRYAYNYSSQSVGDRDGKIGVQRTLVDIDGDNKVEYVLYREMELGKVTLYTEANDGQIVVAVNGGNYVTKDKDDVAGFEEVAQGDYVLTAFFGGVQHVQQAETVTGKINAYKQSDKGALTGETYRTTDFTVDSENYKVSRVKSYDGDITAAIHEVDKSILSSEATFYLDENGYIVAYGEVDENAYKYVLVWGAEANSNILSDRVKVTREDGTEGTYNLSSTSDIDIVKEGNAGKPGKVAIDQDNMAGRVFGYTMTSSGEIKLYLPKNGTVKSNAAPSFTKGLTLIKLTGATVDPDGTPKDAKTAAPYYSNNATTFFYVDATYDGGEIKSIDDVTVYNGRNNAPSVDGPAKDKNNIVMATGATLALNAKGDVAGAAFFNVDVTESADDHMFVYKANFVSEDYVTVDAFMSGDVTATKDVKAALYENGEVVHNPNVDEGIYLYKINSDGNYELTKPNDKAYYFEGYVDRVNKNNNTFVVKCNLDESGKANEIEEFKIDSKSVVIDYDSDDSNPVAVAAGSVSKGDYVQIIVNNTDDHIVLMAAIVSRDPNYTGNPSTGGVDMIWDGKQPANSVKVVDTDDKDTTEKVIREAFNAGKDVFVSGDYDLNDSLTIPKGCKLYVDGNLNATTSAAAGAYNLLNSGSLFVGGNLTTDNGDDASRTKDSVLEVHGNWTLGAATNTNGTVRVGQKIDGAYNLKIEKDSKLYTGAIELGNPAAGTLTVDGHVEVNGYTLKNTNGTTTDMPGNVNATTITVTNNDSLIVKGLLNAANLVIGKIDGTKGRVEAGEVVVSATITMNAGSLTVTTKAVKADSYSFSSDNETSITAKNGFEVATAITIEAKASVSIKGALKAGTGANVTVNGGTLNADKVEFANATDKLIVKGTATVVVPTVDNGQVDISDVKSGASVDVANSPDTKTTLTGTITQSGTYNGEVTITAETGAKIGKDVALVFNGKVSGLNYLSVAEGAKNVKVTFGANAKFEASEATSFMGWYEGAAVSLDSKYVPGGTFTWSGENSCFLLTSHTGTDKTYVYSGTIAHVTVTNSKGLY